jgi:hypothetical protein
MLSKPVTCNAADAILSFFAFYVFADLAAVGIHGVWPGIAAAVFLVLFIRSVWRYRRQLRSC